VTHTLALADFEGTLTPAPVAADETDLHLLSLHLSLFHSLLSHSFDLMTNSLVMMMKKFDIVVVGAGLVGSSFALAMSQRMQMRMRMRMGMGIGKMRGAGQEVDAEGERNGFRIALVERTAPTSVEAICADPVPDNRVSTISPASIRFLQSMKVWDEQIIKSGRYGVFDDMRVWDGPRPSHRIHFETANGAVVENRLISSVLWEELRRQPNVTLITGKENALVKLNLVEKRCRLESGEDLSADLFVAADGPASPVRSMLGLPCFGYDYNRRGVVCTIETENALPPTAYQAFHPNGPVAVLPLWNKFSSVVWSTVPDDAIRLLSLSDDAFLAELNAALAPSVICATKLVPKSRQQFPLRHNHATEYVKEGLALIGDAAHQIHPMAGQGANLGFGDAELLAEILVESVVETGLNVGDLTPLLQYQSQRQKTNLTMAATIDSLHHLFRLQPSHPISHLRGLGMSIVDRLPVLKNFFVAQASGKVL
jgi:2-polyprenylphenol 6-hydroxylase